MRPLLAFALLTGPAVAWTLTAEDRAIIRPPDAVSYLERGKASWYGATGHRTASGEKYPTVEMTCAHKYLPFDTVVRVTRVDDGRAIRCRINDRGPFVSGRVIDLSPQAALGLGMIGSGVAKVKVEVLAP